MILARFQWRGATRYVEREQRSSTIRRKQTLARGQSRPAPQIRDRAEKAVGRRRLRIDQAMQTKAVFQRQHDGGHPWRVQRVALRVALQRGLDDVGDQLAPRA